MPAQDKLSAKELAEEYGYAYSFMKSDPDLWKLFSKAVSGNWAREKFITELKNTKWFKTHSATFREAVARKHSDPGHWKHEVDTRYREIGALAQRFDSTIGWKARRRLAERSILYGWDESRIKASLANFIWIGKDGHFGGELGGIENQVRETARRNGVYLSAGSMRSWMRRIVGGQTTMEDYQASIRNTAQNTFKAFAQDIRGGADMADLADPYLQSMQQILELPDAQADLFDPKIRQALTARDKKGNHVPMGLADFEISLREDPRWRKTRNANDSIADATFGLLNKMGFRS